MHKWACTKSFEYTPQKKTPNYPLAKRLQSLKYNYSKKNALKSRLALQKRLLRRIDISEIQMMVYVSDF